MLEIRPEWDQDVKVVWKCQSDGSSRVKEFSRARDKDAEKIAFLQSCVEEKNERIAALESQRETLVHSGGEYAQRIKKLESEVAQSHNEIARYIVEATAKQFRHLMAPKWNHIETAPKDGRAILLSLHSFAGKTEIQVGQWAGMCEKWAILNTDQFIEPTHWMPLPEPPR